MISRVEEAVRAFESGYNCCQSVFATYADLFGMDRQTALKLSSPMGAGVGRMREVCGAVSAMSLLAGLKYGNTDPDNQEAKTYIYEVVQEMSNRFKQDVNSVVCRDLLKDVEVSEGVAPQKRDKAYYDARPCSRIVALASKIMEETLLIDDYM